jgi:hypothetical protein
MTEVSTRVKAEAEISEILSSSRADQQSISSVQGCAVQKTHYTLQHNGHLYL